MRSVDLKKRSFFKSLSYRLLGTLASMALAYVLTKDLTTSAAVGGLDLVVRIALFYFHERAWDHVAWGRETPPEAVIIFTGLSGAGKSTLAEKLAHDLISQNYTSELLDGDIVRSVFKDVGFGREERIRHLNSMAFIASKLEKQGSIVIGAFICPYEEARQNFRAQCKNYIEVWVDTPLNECERRDVKGLYAKARKGEITSFTGISDTFEAPQKYDIRLDTTNQAIEHTYGELVSELKKRIPQLKNFSIQ